MANSKRIILAALALAAIHLFPAAAWAHDTGQPHEHATQNGPAIYDRPQQADLNRDGLEAVLFYVFAAVVLGSGLAICLTTNVVRMAVYLFMTLAGVAVLFFLLLANFIGVIQLIVYAGGTLILLIFGVMLTSKSPWVRFDVPRRDLIAAGVVCVVLAAALIGVVTYVEWPTTDAAVSGSLVADFGQSLMSTYLVPFEALSVLLLVVMIGAALLARQE